MKEEIQKRPLTLREQQALVAQKLGENAGVIKSWPIENVFAIFHEYADANGKTLSSGNRVNKTRLGEAQLSNLITKERQSIADMFEKPLFADYGAAGFNIFDGGSGEWVEVHCETSIRGLGN